jgi:hypothetical protein
MGGRDGLEVWFGGMDRGDGGRMVWRHGLMVWAMDRLEDGSEG